MTDVIEADCERRKSAFHEAGHAVACVAWGIPIYAASIAPRPQVRHSLWFHANDGTRLQRMAAMRLAGSAAERFFCGAAEDDPADIEKAREYVAYVVPPSEIESEIAALRAEAEWLVRTPWARKRMPSIADALLRDRTLTGEQVRTLCEPLRAS